MVRKRRGAVVAVAVVGLAFVVALGAAQAGPVVPDLLYQDMEEASWTANVASSYNRANSPATLDGVARGNANTVAAGPFGRAGSFDGHGDYVDWGTTISYPIPASQITLEAWINLASIGDGTGKNGCTVLGRQSSYVFGVNSAGALAVYMYGVSGAWLSTDPSVVDMRDYVGKWAHVAATYDGSNKILYLNGDEVAREASSGNVAIGSNTFTGRIDDYGGDRNFHGLLDEVGVHSRALTLQGIRQQAAVGPDVLELRMDESSWNSTPGEVIDSSGKGHHGTAYSGATTVGESSFNMLGRSGLFDGINNRVDCGSASSLVPGGSGMSLEAWVKPDSLASWAKDGMVVVKSSTYYLKVRPDGTVGAYFASGGGTQSWFFSDEPCVSDDIWQHLVAVRDGVDESIWVNGVMVASRDGGSLSSLPVISANDVLVGYDTYHGHFDGLIDQVGIYSWALDERQINARYMLGVPEPTSLALLGVGLVALCRRKKH